MDWIKNSLIIVVVTLTLIGALEIAARVYIYMNYGTGSAGLPERTTYLKYTAFTMWGKDLDRIAQDYTEKVSNDDFRILVIGGSTGQGFSDVLIKETFEKDDRISNVSVFNSASGGFNIRQEAIALMMTANKIKPNLILALDGANDMMHAIRPGVKPGTTYVDRSFTQILHKPYLGPIIYALQNSQLYNGMLRLFSRQNFDADKAAEAIGPAKAIYLQTRDFINEFAKGADIPIVFMLQPHVGFSQSPADKESKDKFLYREDIIVESFKDITRQSNEGLCFVDSNKRLYDEKLNLEFSDDVHFKNAVGYQYLASLYYKKYKECYGK